jgi:methyl-accepting chemotaxis protein
MEAGLRAYDGFRGFTASKFVGFNLEPFFGEAPGEFRKLWDRRNLPYQNLVTLGTFVFDFYVVDMVDESGQHVGYIVSASNASEKTTADKQYSEALKAITDRMDFLRTACAADLANAMQSLAVGNLTIELTPKTPLLDIPDDPDLAKLAETFNGLRNQTVKSVEAYNKARNSIVEMVGKQAAMAGDLSKAMEGLASGNLTVAIDVESSNQNGGPVDPELIADFFGGMRKQTVKSVEAYNSARQSLSAAVAQTRVASESIVQASSEITTGTDDLSQRTEEQASSLEETASSMEEMTSTVKQNADNARQANQLSAQARDVAEKGSSVVGSAVQSMEEINTASKRIADIISVIDEIAFQTNLLALNAAVEAARVGEQGRGFAVVAAEVRNLAGRSATAAKEIKALVQDSVQKVQEGSSQVNQSGQTLEEIVNAVKKVADIISEISAASQEQASGIEQVNKAVMQMDQITQQNAALVEETAAASQSMTQQAAGVKEMLSRFTLDAAAIAAAQAAAETASAAKPSGKAASHRPSRSPAPASGKNTPRRSVTASKQDEEGFEEF